MQEPPPVPILLAEMARFAHNTARYLTLPDINWECRPASGEWCLTEVACHLRDVEIEVHQPRFRALIAADNAFLPGAVADSWVEERHYAQQNGPQALADFLAARQETLALLSHLPDAVWPRRGRHAYFGPTSMHELLNLAVQHDQAHWEQITALAGVPPSPPSQ